MKKKTLLAMPELLATDRMVYMAQEDKGRMKKIYSWSDKKFRVYRHNTYIRVCVQDGILKVAFFLREDLANGIRMPSMEVYLSKEEEKHLTYLPGEQKWLTGKIDSMDAGSGNESYYTRLRMAEEGDWQERGAARQVWDYTGYRNIGIYTAILRYQSLVAKNRLNKSYQREKMEIDAAMEQVPALPKDWENWVYYSAYCREHYIFYHYGDKQNRAYCSRCGKEVRLKKQAYHRKKARCPECGNENIALAWDRQNTTEDHKKVGILQERLDKNGYVLRIFESRIKRGKAGEWKLSTEDSFIYERYRILFTRDFYKGQEYEYTNFKHRGENEVRWCYYAARAYYYERPGECILYHRNLKRLRKGTAFKYLPLEELYSHNQGYYAHVPDQIYLFRTHPQLEYLIKLHLYRLVWDFSKIRGSGIIDRDKKKPWEALGIDKQQLAMAVRMDISARQLQTMKKANSLGIRMGREMLEWYTLEIGPDLLTNILHTGHPEKKMKYMQWLEEEGTRIGDYVDYLVDIEKLGIPPTDDVLFPKNFQPAHERLSDQVREKEEKIKKAKVEEKDRMLREMLWELSEIYLDTEANDYLMVLPTCKEDFNREGRENHNCVGGHYFEDMLRGDCVILFLRRREEPEQAFCTVEMEGSRVVQCRAIRNSNPPAEVMDFMQRYSREVEKRIRKRKVRIQVAV